MRSDQDTALIVVDMQNDFLAQGGYYDRRSNNESTDALSEPSPRRAFAARMNVGADFVDRIIRCVSVARVRDWPIIFLQAVYGPEFGYQPWFLVREPSRRHYPCKPRTWGAELVDPIAKVVADNPENRKKALLETTLEKHTFDGFLGTGLAALLSRRRVRRVVLVGIETHVCVLSTAVSAACQGFVTTIGPDCVWTGNGELNEPALELFRDAFGKAIPFDEFCN